MNFLYIHFLIPLHLLANVQICEIIYNKNDLDKLPFESNPSLSNPHQKKCSRIGYEYTPFDRPDLSKPIFACCRNKNQD